MNGERIKRVCVVWGLMMALYCPAWAQAHRVTYPSRSAGSHGSNTLPSERRPCNFGPPNRHPLSLEKAIDRALCVNPDTREAWAVIRQRNAQVGQAKATYLPKLSATGQWVHENTVTNVRDHGALSTNYSSAVHSSNVSLTWLLYDFGERKANLAEAKALLAVARSSSDQVLQKTLARTVKAYYAVLAANSRLRTDTTIVADADQSVLAAKRRVTHGVAPDTEVYQSKTVYGLANIQRMRDNGLALEAQGTLATLMGLTPGTRFVLAHAKPVYPSASAHRAVTVLMARAVRSHPAVAAAKAQLEAAKAGVKAARAKGQPTISLVARYSRDNTPVQMGLGLPHYPATGHDGYIGVQISIPIFSGFATSDAVSQAKAKVEQDAAALDKARRQVALEVWNSYQTLKADGSRLQAAMSLKNVAMKAWKSSQRRYRSGVGSILELLATQKSLAQARQKRLKAATQYRDARLALALALGRLGHGTFRVHRKKTVPATSANSRQHLLIQKR